MTLGLICFPPFWRLPRFEAEGGCAKRVCFLGFPIGWGYVYCYYVYLLGFCFNVSFREQHGHVIYPGTTEYTLLKSKFGAIYGLICISYRVTLVISDIPKASIITYISCHSWTAKYCIHAPYSPNPYRDWQQPFPSGGGAVHIALQGEAPGGVLIWSGLFGLRDLPM